MSSLSAQELAQQRLADVTGIDESAVSHGQSTNSLYVYEATVSIWHWVIVAIVVMVLMWALVQHILFDSQIHVFTYIFKAMPILQNNPLVFITPFVVAALTIIGCVALRNVVIAVFKA